jgi:hypothetical protein
MPSPLAYLDIDEADSILALEPVDRATWSALGDEEKLRLLVAATRWLDDRAIWKGQRSDPLQALGWPRRNAYDREGRVVAADAIPEAVRRATALVAHFLASNPVDDSNDRDGVRRFRADTFEIEYQQGFYSSPSPTWLRFVLIGLGQIGSERGLKPIMRV